VRTADLFARVLFVAAIYKHHEHIRGDGGCGYSHDSTNDVDESYGVVEKSRDTAHDLLFSIVSRSLV
jgi:hypothetical protein